MSTRFIKKINNKQIIFYDNNTSRTTANFNNNSMSQDKQNEELNNAADNFIKQKKDELERIFLNYNSLEISLTTGLNTQIIIHEEIKDSFNQRIGKIFLNINWFLNFKLI